MATKVSSALKTFAHPESLLITVYCSLLFVIFYLKCIHPYTVENVICVFCVLDISLSISDFITIKDLSSFCTVYILDRNGSMK